MNLESVPQSLHTGFSRLRLRLAAAFTTTLVLSLAVVAVGSFGWLLYESARRLDDRLATLAIAASRTFELEKEEHPDWDLPAVVRDIKREWVVERGDWIVLDTTGALVAATMDAAVRARVLDSWSARSRTFEPLVVPHTGTEVRVIPVAIPASAALPPYTVLTVATTDGIARDTQLLATAFAVALPLIALMSLGGGYWLSRWAMQPARTLGLAIDALDPTSLAARLPVAEQADEISHLAMRFNALLDRVAALRAQNREFIREAAHQIRTPLTLVRGESELALAASAPPVATLQNALSRVERASRQMQRRVDELLLLAEAEAGTVLEELRPVELDALATDGVDLFRARATQRGRPLRYGTIESAQVLGDQALLGEALLELLENACRHGCDETPITVTVRRRDQWADLAVASHRPSSFMADTEPSSSEPPSSGLGQRIVRWIADVHSGHFAVAQDASGHYIATLTMPLAPKDETSHLSASPA